MVDRIAKTQGKPVDKSANLQGCVLVLWITALLAGCATMPAPTVQRVEIPIERECLPADLPERPEVSTDDQLRALPNDKYVLTVSAERQELRDYSIKAEAAIKGCR